MAEICVAIVDDLLFLCFYCNIYEMKPDIFEIFRTFSRYLEKKSGISGNIFRRFFVIFVYRPSSPLLLLKLPISYTESSGFENDVTWDDSQRPSLVQHVVAILDQCCDYLAQCCNNVATLCCAKIVVGNRPVQHHHLNT